MPKAAVHRIRPWTILLPFVVAAFGVGCTAETSQTGELGEAPVGAVRGALETNVATFDNGNTDTQYLLHATDGREIKLVFDSEPDIAGNANVDVWGDVQGDQMRVRRYEVIPASRIEQALVMGTAYTPRSFAFVIVNNGTPTTQLAQADAERKLFGVVPNMVPSVRQYYMEVSYGRQDIGGMVVGPLSFQMTGCNTGALATMLTPMVPGMYNHYLWYIQPRNPMCGWSGLASSGTPNRPSKGTWYNASSGCVVLVQEPGHNFGMQHSSAMKCNNVPIVDDNLNAMGCVHQEYGDRFDPMGGGCRHMNAFQKAYQGWFDKCNLVDTSGVEGTFTLLPLELPCDGVQALTVPFPHTRMFMRSGGGGGATNDALTNYLIEMRAPIGIDGQLGATVQIRAAGNLRDRAQRGLHTWILDMNPATPMVFDGLGAGQSFTDPSGSPKITVMTLDNTKATVKVEFPTPIMGATPGPTCLDDTPFTGPGPGPESCAKQVASAAGAPPAIPDGGATPPPTQPPRDAGGRDTAAPSSPDAGAPGTGGEGGGAGGASGAGGTAGGGPAGGSGGGSGAGTPPVVVSSGCGCRLGSAGNEGTGGTVLACGLALVALVFRRRRSR